MMLRTSLPIWLTAALLFSARAMAAEHMESAGLDEHTTKTIIYQCINVTILFAVLFYYLRKPAREFFNKKRQDFVATAERALEQKRNAERERAEIQIRLTKLESTADESISRARAEAADMKQALIAEAQTLSKRIHQEAQAAASLEAEKAKHQLREQMIKNATSIVSQQLSTQLTGEDQRRLEGEFIDHIQAVRP